MKIAITGHKHGLGQAIYNKLVYYNKGAQHTVIGFDVEDGYDISNKLQMGKILFNSRDCDVFINNAYHPIGQTAMLKFLLKMWKGKKKTIVNIGTFYVHYDSSDWIKNDAHQTYYDQKVEQQTMINKIRDNSLKVIQVNPGLLQTGFINRMDPTQNPTDLLKVEDCADVILHALDMLKKNIYIPEIDLLDKRLYN